MYIKCVSIENFRGLSILVNNLDRDFLLIGKNDSGKSNFCYAIRKVLDFDIRKTPLDEADSSNFNKEPIKIEIVFNLEGISIANRSKIGKHIDKQGDSEEFTVRFEGVFNEDTQFYDEKIIFGTIDQSKEISTNQGNILDKVLEIVYISPNYNYAKEEKNFFKYKQSKNVEDKVSISQNIIDSINLLNGHIKNDPSILEIKNDINTQDGFNSIFEDVYFDMSSNISVSNMYQSLNIVPLNKEGKEINSIGDGKNKTLSMLLQKMSHSDEKHKILIVEEPENHLYPLLQKHYADLTSKMDMNQVIYTSHSPHIIDFKKMNQIIKIVSWLDQDIRRTFNYSINISENDYKKFGYLLNEEIAEMFFYDSVLLVEGVSEKYFYNALYLQDEIFRKYVIEKKMGIFCVMGIDFGPAKELLNKLGVSVFIKTDNDIFKVPKIDKKRYAGYDRTLGCLTDKGINELSILFNNAPINKDTFRFDKNKEVDPFIESKIEEINDIFAKSGVFISSDHDGFEHDFLNFIGEDTIDNEDLEYLKQAKLKNLHKYVQENNITLNINEANKKSTLVRFIYYD
ncbi:ATP-dependent nuclease [Erysipelothrix anatis]|uniref:ATP-dependent nuclease n=1 Tax=Erysipelothrix anatis TaxID=2683713 RepID=UPI001356E211|nr:AAA family ATPase [Erysipelothrix anatis]